MLRQRVAEAPKVEIVEFVKEPGPCHVVEVEQGGVKRRVTVGVDEGAWIGLGWFASDAEGSIRSIVLRYVERHAADGSLKDRMFVSNDEAKEIHGDGSSKAASSDSDTTLHFD